MEVSGSRPPDGSLLLPCILLFLASSSYPSSSSSSSWCPTLLWSEVLRPLSSCCCQLVALASQHSEEIIWEGRHHGHWGHHGHHRHCGLVRRSTSLYFSVTWMINTEIQMMIQRSLDGQLTRWEEMVRGTASSIPALVSWLNQKWPPQDDGTSRQIDTMIWWS